MTKWRQRGRATRPEAQDGQRDAALRACLWLFPVRQRRLPTLYWNLTPLVSRCHSSVDISHPPSLHLPFLSLPTHFKTERDTLRGAIGWASSPAPNLLSLLPPITLAPATPQVFLAKPRSGLAFTEASSPNPLLTTSPAPAFLSLANKTKASSHGRGFSDSLVQ